MPKEEMRKLWSLEACSICGTEGYATRTESIPVSESYVCVGQIRRNSNNKEFLVKEIDGNRVYVIWLGTEQSIEHSLHAVESCSEFVRYNNSLGSCEHKERYFYDDGMKTKGWFCKECEEALDGK